MDKEVEQLQAKEHRCKQWSETETPGSSSNSIDKAATKECRCVEWFEKTMRKYLYV